MIDNQQPVPDSIIRKIQLLFQLAQSKTGHDGTNNENEAAAAMAKAQELLAAYNLDMATIQGTSVAGGTVQAEEKRDEVKSARTAMYEWQQALCKAIAEANFCVYWVAHTTDYWQISGGVRKKFARPRNVKRHVVLGRQQNTLAVQMMYEYLADTIEQLLPYKGSERLSRSANSWREGCSDRLIERIESKVAEMKKSNQTSSSEEVKPEASTTTAITVRDYFEREEEGNYDARYGKGAWAKRKARMAKLEEEIAADRIQQKEALKKAMEARKQLLASETPEERARRVKKEAAEEEKQRRADERYWRSQDNKERREEERRDHSAYYSGRNKGDKIGLDAQLKHSNVQKKGDLKW